MHRSREPWLLPAATTTAAARRQQQRRGEGSLPRSRSWPRQPRPSPQEEELWQILCRMADDGEGDSDTLGASRSRSKPTKVRGEVRQQLACQTTQNLRHHVPSPVPLPCRTTSDSSLHHQKQQVRREFQSQRVQLQQQQWRQPQQEPPQPPEYGCAASDRAAQWQVPPLQPPHPRVMHANLAGPAAEVPNTAELLRTLKKAFARGSDGGGGRGEVAPSHAVAAVAATELSTCLRGGGAGHSAGDSASGTPVQRCSSEWRRRSTEKLPRAVTTVGATVPPACLSGCQAASKAVARPGATPGHATCRRAVGAEDSLRTWRHSRGFSLPPEFVDVVTQRPTPGATRSAPSSRTSKGAASARSPELRPAPVLMAATSTPSYRQRRRSASLSPPARVRREVGETSSVVQRGNSPVKPAVVLSPPRCGAPTMRRISSKSPPTHCMPRPCPQTPSPRASWGASPQSHAGHTPGVLLDAVTPRAAVRPAGEVLAELLGAASPARAPRRRLSSKSPPAHITRPGCSMPSPCGFGELAASPPRVPLRRMCSKSPPTQCLPRSPPSLPRPLRRISTKSPGPSSGSHCGRTASPDQLCMPSAQRPPPLRTRIEQRLAAAAEEAKVKASATKTPADFAGQWTQLPSDKLASRRAGTKVGRSRSRSARESRQSAADRCRLPERLS